jgi:phosphoribosylaminoimidazolecarboxamide formyltransferase/IMP cyclohydrolase
VKDNVKVQRALVSVYDKSGLLELARALIEQSVEILSTGGTSKYLRENNLPVTNVSDVTGFPEILGGRVKTLHPKVHGGILAKRDHPEQMQELSDHQILPIDMVVVNLYPFEKTIAKPDVSMEEAQENIDIGGPCMIRAAAKNFSNVAVLTDPSQYPAVLGELKQEGGTVCLRTRHRLAAEAFQGTQQYDTAIANFLAGKEKEADAFPEIITLSMKKVQDLRYGENPHQKAALFTDACSTAGQHLMGRQLHGKDLSFNNILDINSAIGLASEFERPCAVIVKHNNPCGVAVDDNLVSAYENAFSTDSVSAFGGVVALNKTVTKELAELLASVFLEVVVGPRFAPDALEILTKKKNLRLIEWPGTKQEAGEVDIKKVFGGYLLQSMDIDHGNEENYRVVTNRQPREIEWSAMRFSWKIVKWVKSNAVIFVSDKKTLGIGAGQMSRVDSSKIAVQKAREAGQSLEGSIVASDAFFPFRDGIDAAAAAGAGAVIQPGGSVRDSEVIEAANEHKMAMVFTGIRHFRH